MEITLRDGRVCVLRQAQLTPEDASALHAVEHASLHDSGYSPSEMLEVLRRPEHVAYVAWQGEAPVGFCSCFETPALSPHSLPTRRLEVDMLGVLPQYRGRGIATALLSLGLAEARQRELHTARAAVGTSNPASQAAFARAGLVPDRHRYTMLIYVIHGLSPVEYLPAGWHHRVLVDAAELAFERHMVGPDTQAERPFACAHTLRVQTLSYRGLWIEAFSPHSRPAAGVLARGLVEHAKGLGLDEVGYLLPQGGAAEELQRSFLREGYVAVGEYLLFRADLSGAATISPTEPGAPS